MEQPLYTEKHYTLGPLITLLVTVAIISVVTIIFPLEVKSILPVIIFLGLIVFMFFIIGPWSKVVMTVDYFKDRLVVDAGKKKKAIFYKDIKTVWKGNYFLRTSAGFGMAGHNRGKIYFDKFPGGDIGPDRSRKYEDYQKVDEILTWSPSRRFSRARHGTPFLIQRAAYSDIIHVKDEKTVVNILKKNAPWVKLPTYWE